MTIHKPPTKTAPVDDSGVYIRLMVPALRVASPVLRVNRPPRPGEVVRGAEIGCAVDLMLDVSARTIELLIDLPDTDRVARAHPLSVLTMLPVDHPDSFKVLGRLS